MPRNPSKTRCQKPGCRSWAMRGHSLCRSHRDDELGLRGGGAPHHNLNAVKTGAHAHPLASLNLAQLAKDLVHHPDDLPDLIGIALQSIHARTRHPYKTLAALRTALSRLLPLVEAQLLVAQVDAVLRELPPSLRRPFMAAVRRQATGPLPQSTLDSIREWVIESEKKRKTSTGTAGRRNGKDA